jgi:hypothetical protein
MILPARNQLIEVGGGYRQAGEGDIANLAGVVNFLPHPSPPLGKGRE